MSQRIECTKRKRRYRQLCECKINLDHYQIREIPSEIQECKVRYSSMNSLLTEIKRYEAEFGKWNLEWEPTYKCFKERRELGWKLITFKPKSGIRGWVWVSPRGRIKDLYVSRRYRGFGWGLALTYAALNTVAESTRRQARIIFEDSDLRLKYLIENVISSIGCKVVLQGVEVVY